MSADIISTQARSTSARLKRGSSKAAKLNQQLLGLHPQDDPALIVGLTLAFARQGPPGTRTIPSVLLEPLRRLAESGDPTCRLVLNCLERRAGANHWTDAGQGVPTEIVSVYPAMKEDR